MKRGALFALAVVMVIGTLTILVWRTQDPLPPGIGSLEDGHSVETSVRPLHEGRGPGTVSQQMPTPLWRVVDEHAVAAKPPFADEWSEAGRALVDVSGAADRARTWRVGDRLVLPLPQLGEVYEWTIDRIDDGPGRSRSARGLVAGTDGRSRRVVVTVGPSRVFAYLDTPQGPYELVAGARLGWLLPTSSMLAGFDFSEPDYLLQQERAENGATQ